MKEKLHEIFIKFKIFVDNFELNCCNRIIDFNISKNKLFFLQLDVNVFIISFMYTYQTSNFNK